MIKIYLPKCDHLLIPLRNAAFAYGTLNRPEGGVTGGYARLRNAAFAYGTLNRPEGGVTGGFA